MTFTEQIGIKRSFQTVFILENQTFYNLGYRVISYFFQKNLSIPMKQNLDFRNQQRKYN